MATDQSFTRLYNKKILPLLSMKDQMLDYLRQLITSAHADMFSADAVLGQTKAAVVTANPAANNKIDIANAAALRGVTGTGYTISVAADDSRLQAVKVPPDAGVSYHVGLEQNAVDAGIETNPRTGEFEYSNYTELLGRVLHPTSVTDNGNGTLTINVNSLFESGKDNSGRSVRVWLKSRTDGGIGPLSASEAVAIQTIAVAFSAPNNTIAVPNLMGQTAASTTAADYWVMSIGPTIQRAAHEDLRTTSGCLFLAAVTSVAAANPIVTTSTTDQRLVKSTLSQIGAEGTISIHGGAFRADAASPTVNQSVTGTTCPADTGGLFLTHSVDVLIGKRITEIRMYVRDDASPASEMSLYFGGTNQAAASLHEFFADSNHSGTEQVLVVNPNVDMVLGESYIIQATGDGQGGNLVLRFVEIDYIPIP